MDDQELIDSLAESVGAVLANNFSIEEVLKFTNVGGELDAEIKRRACELGWLGIAAPESLGGGGLGIEALVPIYCELGEHLSSLPFIGQQLCIDALVACAFEQDGRLAALVEGAAWGAVAPELSFDSAGIGRDGALEADDIPVFDDDHDSHLLLFGREADGEPVALMLDIRQAERRAVAFHDHTRRLRMLAPGGLPVTRECRLASGDAAIALQTRLGDHLALALAADSVGGCRAVLARTIDYLKTREQFGRAIGSFQALKHRAATMKLELETAASLLRVATACFGKNAKSSALASLAKARACDVYVKLSGEAIQLHGGIGFTRECPVHLHLKRAKLNQALCGGDRASIDRAANLLVGRAA